ncbi:prepilin-type N-terminal cleavage/methylation domain-containing protein [Ningiella sp. W23]|uniref:prepilin-type N-terminal cleavage/methylation domain-containing protein n=1 Tax=Ningiella sp. W23 TaxID=3023715 RepID=UPI0037575788
MMQTLATSPKISHSLHHSLHNKTRQKIAAGGYTLLELLIVLVLMGLLTGIATPRLLQMYESVNFSLERDDILFQLEGLPFAVYQSGESFSLLSIQDDESSEFLSLPEGWELDDFQTSEVIYNAFGYCTGGEVSFVKGERTLQVSLEPPTCRPVALED